MMVATRRASLSSDNSYFRVCDYLGPNFDTVVKFNYIRRFVCL